jgi:PAS domain S-box-containing protein
VNDAAANAFGISRTQLYGKTDDEVFPSATAAQFRENDRRAVQSGAGLQSVEVLEHPDGELRYSLVSKFPLFDAEGHVKLIGGMAIDITEQRRFEQALRQSEARFRSLMEQAPFSIQVFSPDGRTTRVNRAWETLWGVRFNEISGYNILEDRQLEEKGIATFIRKGFAGETCRIPAIEYNPNDTIPDVARDPDPRRWLSAVIYPIKDADGHVQEVVLIHEDITLQHRAEAALLDAHRDLESKVALRTAELAQAESKLRTAHEELERRVAQRTKELAHVNDALRDADRQKDELLTTLTASEQFHRAIADLSTDYAFSGTIDADGSVNIYNVTEGFDKFYGMSLEEMNAQGGWASVIHPDDHAAVQRTIERLLASQTDRGELRAQCKDGTVKWQSYLTVPVRDDTSGRTIGLYGAATDVTAQRQLTEQLREQASSLEAILSASVDNIYLFDRDGRYRYVSAGGAKILGFRPQEMTGKSWRELGLPAEIMETFDAQREQAIASGKSHRHDVSFRDKARRRSIARKRSSQRRVIGNPGTRTAQSPRSDS